MRLLRYLLVPLLLLPLLFAAVWHWRNSLSEFALVWLMQGAGFGEVAANIGSLTPEGAHIDKLAFVDPSGDWRFEADDVALDYRLDELIEGQVDKISAARVAIDARKPVTQAESPSLDLLQGVALLRGPWREQIPFREARVERLSLNGEVFKGLNGAALSAEMALRASQASARLWLLDQPDSPRELAIESATNDQVTIDLRSPGSATESPVTASLQLAEETLSGEAVVDLSALRRWLQPLVGEVLPESLHGVLNTKAELHVAAEKEYSLDLGLTTPQLQWDNLAVDGLSMLIVATSAGDDSLASVELQPGSRIALEAWRQVDFAFGPGELAFSGEFERHEEENWRFAFQPESRAEVGNLQAGTLQNKTLELALSGEISGGPDETRIRLAPGFEAALSGLSIGDSLIPQLHLAPREESNIVLSGETPPAWEFKPGGWLVETGEIDAGVLILLPGPVEVSLQRLAGKDDRWELAAGLDSDSLLLKSDDLEIPVVDINAQIKGDSQKIELTGGLSPGGLPGRMAFVLRQDLEQERGSVKLTTGRKIDLSDADDSLSELLNSWPYEFDLVTGEIDIELHSDWSPGKPASLAMDLAVADGGGNFQQALFSGLEADGAFDLLPELKTNRSAGVKVETLDFGIMLQNIDTKITLRPVSSGPEPLLKAVNLSGNAFRAGFASKRMIYDLNTATGSLNLSIEGIDLEHLVTLAEMEGVAATGALNGYLPIKITANGVTVDQGRLWSVPPGGQLSYRPEGNADADATQQSSSMTEYALKALRDYRYHQLAAKLQYEPDGTLVIDLQMKGISPELDPKRPVHLNINLEQNLLSLLKSLRYTQGLNDQLDKQVQDHYQKKTNIH